VLLIYSGGRRSSDVPQELLPQDARAGGVLEAGFTHDREETERMRAENKALLDELLGRDG
jgi:Protein of unknown function (DUF3006)